MTTGSKLHEVWLVVREHGWVTTRDVAGALGYSEHGVAPLLWWLTYMGWAMRRGSWWASARVASWTP